MDNIMILSPHRSGNIFTSILLSMCFDTQIKADHELDMIANNTHKIYIVRNPYEVIASSMQSHIRGEKDFRVSEDIRIEVGYSEKFCNLFDLYCSKYRYFLENTINNLDYITPVDFAFIMDDSKKFANQIATKYNMKSSFTKDITNEEIVARIKKSLENYDRVENMPREKTAVRKEIDHIVRNNIQVADLYRKYLEYKDKYIAVDWKI